MSDMTDTAPSIVPLPQAEWTPDAREIFAYWEGPDAYENGSRSNTMMTLANHPRLAKAQLDFGKYLLVDCTLSPRQKELVILRVAWRYNSPYQWAHHVHSGRQIGMTDAEFAALQQEGPAACWSAQEQAMLDATDQLCARGRVDDATWAILSAAMDRHQLMDFLYSVGFFTMNAWAFGAMGIQLELGFEDFSKPTTDMIPQE